MFIVKQPLTLVMILLKSSGRTHNVGAINEPKKNKKNKNEDLQEGIVYRKPNENMEGFVWLLTISNPLRHKSQCFLRHCSQMEKVGG